MLLVDEGEIDGLIVFVRDGLVYLNLSDSLCNGNLANQIDTVLHYSEKSDKPIEDILQLEHITELYQKEGVQKFKV